jgi:hypothetical protein
MEWISVIASKAPTLIASKLANGRAQNLHCFTLLAPVQARAIQLHVD